MHNTPSRTRTFIPLGEAAEILGVNPRTLRRWIAEGRLTGYRVGPTMVRVDRAEVEGLAHRIPTAG